MRHFSKEQILMYSKEYKSFDNRE